MGADLRTIVVSVARAGHVNQCLAVCEALGWPVVNTITVPAPGRMDGGRERLLLNMKKRIVTARIRPRRRRPGPLRIVASGRSAAPVAAAYRRLYGDDLFLAFVGAPRGAGQLFDVAVVSRHELERGQAEDPRLFPSAREVVWMSGVPVRALPAAPEHDGPPALVAMIGGTNKAYAIDSERIVSQLRARAAGRPATVVAFSRRTPPEVERHVRAALAADGTAFVDPADRGGFERAMNAASGFLVTPDSISMICEACATGKPVAVFDLACFDRDVSTARFVECFLAEGRIALATSRAASAFAAPKDDDVFAAVDRVHDAWIGSAGLRT